MLSRRYAPQQPTSRGAAGAPEIETDLGETDLADSAAKSPELLAEWPYFA